MPYDRLPVRATTARDKVSTAQGLRPSLAAKTRIKITAPNLSKTRAADPRVTFAAAIGAKPQNPEIVAEGGAAPRAARIANEQRLASICYGRASRWAPSAQCKLRM
jgi:hypothetical protein